MIRLILVFILWVMLVIGGIAVALYYLLGWKGLVLFPIVMLVLLWVLKKVIGALLRNLFMGLFGRKAAVLRGAGMEVHSVTPVTVVRKMEPAGAAADEDEGGEDGGEDKVDKVDEVEEMKHYFDVDMTITPKGRQTEGHVWEPSEFVLVSEPTKQLKELSDKEVGSTHEIRIWNGTEFGEDDPGKYPGTQRLKATFEVKQGTKKAWLQYYNETIGPITFPEWKVG